MKFEALGGKQGPLHGLAVDTPYLTKDYLQLKRFQAQHSGTTYVYDFPEMFRQVGQVASAGMGYCETRSGFGSCCKELVKRMM